MIGRALVIRGRWIFEPSKRGRRLPLAWRGSAAPEDGDYVIAWQTGKPIVLQQRDLSDRL